MDAVKAPVVMGHHGNLVIPPRIRAALGLHPGDLLQLHVIGRRLFLERRQDAVAGLQALAQDVPATRSLVEELFAERRLSADTQ